MVSPHSSHVSWRERWRWRQGRRWTQREPLRSADGEPTNCERNEDRIQNNCFVYYTTRILRNAAMPGPLTPCTNARRAPQWTSARSAPLVCIYLELGSRAHLVRSHLSGCSPPFSREPDLRRAVSSVCFSPAVATSPGLAADGAHRWLLPARRRVLQRRVLQRRALQPRCGTSRRCARRAPRLLRSGARLRS